MGKQKVTVISNLNKFSDYCGKKLKKSLFHPNMFCEKTGRRYKRDLYWHDL